jgi:hypothetical protein
MLIPLSLLAARGGHFLLFEESSHSGARSARRLLALVLLALFAGNLLPEAGRYRREYLYDRQLTDRATFLHPYGKWGGGDMCPLASQAVADYLTQHTSPADPVLIFGLEPGLYVMAQRFSPTRFAYDQPLVTDPKGDAAFAKYRDSLRERFMSDLAARPPKYIVVIENDATSVEDKDSYTQMREFSDFNDFVDGRYVLETKIEDYFMFRRLDQGAGAP